jgi:mRNA-degrading endonuclease toxin of MazEF toxin-antitoxin module
VSRIAAGSIVIIDWRGDALPKEPNKLRPAIVVEDDGLFHPSYPNVIVVPLTEDAGLAIPGLSVTIDPTPQNGCTKRCFALAPFVTSASVMRVRATASRITDDQLHRIRHFVAEAIGAT